MFLIINPASGINVPILQNAVNHLRSTSSGQLAGALGLTGALSVNAAEFKSASEPANIQSAQQFLGTAICP
jgi:hypothetical protein